MAFGLSMTGFAKLRHADAGFRTPMALLVVGPLGLMMIAAGFGLLLGEFLQVAGCGGLGCVAPNSLTL